MKEWMDELITNKKNRESRQSRTFSFSLVWYGENCKIYHFTYGLPVLVNFIVDWDEITWFIFGAESRKDIINEKASQKICFLAKKINTLI